MKKLIFALLVCTYGIVHAEDGSAFEHHTPITYSTTNIGDSDFEYAIRPSYIFTFSNKQGMVGTLDFGGQEMTFKGNADKSARVFFDYLDAQFASRLAAERKKARDDVEFCVREHLKSGESPLLCFD